MNAKTWIRETAKLEAELNAQLDAENAQRSPARLGDQLVRELEDALQDQNFFVNFTEDKRDADIRLAGALEKIRYELNRRERQPEQKTMLQNAFRMAATKYREGALWAFVQDICCVNSSTARDICHAHGWHPDQIGTMTENKK